VRTEDAHRELLAYELEGRAPTPPPPSSPSRPAPPQPRHHRSWIVAGAIVAAALLVAIGVAIGALARNRVVNDQRRRAVAAEKHVSSLQHDLAQKQSAIDEQQRQIARDREEEAGLRETIARQARAQQPPPSNASAVTTFGDGLYQVRVAIRPGQYQTDGSDSCYWAKLSTGDTNRVIDNHLGAGAQTVTIDSPYFESEGCGTWIKVG
jgi:hypothetical protein